ncbi:hypothetical protein CAEBREN_24856 [Caenorhabditis brenneri]|uniref:ribonuclease H n=1 Tax=Caenorhabditis brenneri TaxID=135651 RepID=G0P1N2_CAEBE|nr:hypothetical protein CAEBREN_24856 [Caenorhabditis brenneri]
MREFIEEQLTRLYCDQNYSGNNREWYVEENERKKYHAFVFTDGSYRERPQKITGIGVFWGDDHPNNYCGLVHGDPSNNRAELCAAHHAIGQAFREDYRAVTIISDSKFVKNILEDPDRFDIKTHDKMKDLLVSIRIMRPFIKINIFIVKGHAGNYGNEEADRLARFVTWSQSKESKQTELEKTREIQLSERAILKKERIRRHTMYQLAAIRQGYDLDPQQDVFDQMGAPIGYLSRASIRRFITANLPYNPEPFMESSMDSVPNDIFSNMGPPIGFDPFLKMERWVNPGGVNPQQVQMWHYQSQHVAYTMGAEEKRRRVENVQVLQVNSEGLEAGNDKRKQSADRQIMLVKCQDPCCAIRPMPQAPAPRIAPCAQKNPALNGYNNNVLKNLNVNNMNSTMKHPMRPPGATHVRPVPDQENQAPHMRPCAPGNPGMNGGSPPMGPVVSSIKPIQSKNVMTNCTYQPMKMAPSLVGKPMISPVNNQVLSTMYVEERKTKVENVQMYPLNSGPSMAAFGTRRQMDRPTMLQRPQTPVPPISPCALRNQAPNSYYLPMGPPSSSRHIERNNVMRNSTNQPMQMTSSLVGKPMVLPVNNQVMSKMWSEESRRIVEMRRMNSGPPVAPMNNVYPDASTNRPNMLMKCQRSCCSMRPTAQVTAPPMGPGAPRNSAPNGYYPVVSSSKPVLNSNVLKNSTNQPMQMAPAPKIGPCAPRNPDSNGYSPPMGPVSTNSVLKNSNLNNMNVPMRYPMRPPASLNLSFVPDQENQVPVGQRPPMRKRQRLRPCGQNSANSMMLNKKVAAGPVKKMSTMVVKEQSGPSAPMNNPLSSENSVSAVPNHANPLKSISPVTNVTTITPYSSHNETGPLLSTDDPLTDTSGQDSTSPPEIMVTSVEKSPSKIFYGFSVPNFMIFQRVFELTCVFFVDTKGPSEIPVVELD